MKVASSSRGGQEDGVCVCVCMGGWGEGEGGYNLIITA